MSVQNVWLIILWLLKQAFLNRSGSQMIPGHNSLQDERYDRVEKAGERKLENVQADCTAIIMTVIIQYYFHRVACRNHGATLKKYPRVHSPVFSDKAVLASQM